MMAQLPVVTYEFLSGLPQPFAAEEMVEATARWHLGWADAYRLGLRANQAGLLISPSVLRRVAGLPDEAEIVSVMNWESPAYRLCEGYVIYRLPRRLATPKHVDATVIDRRRLCDGERVGG